MPLLSLFALGLISAVLSHQPIFFALLAVPVLAAGWYGATLGFSKINGIKLISVILPSGKVRVKFHEESKIEGYLCGQQWFNSHVAVLRFKTEIGIQSLVLLSRQQDKDHYRRLRVWLRHDFSLGTGDNQVPGVAR